MCDVDVGRSELTVGGVGGDINHHPLTTLDKLTTQANFSKIKTSILKDMNS